MQGTDRKAHWEGIYQTKQLTDVSWYQQKPSVIDWLEQYAVPKTASIIDIGGGDSFLADQLLALGYTDVTVLDISEAAIERAKTRLGERAALVKWVVADASQFVPERQYDFWYDRAAFHFLTGEADVAHYVTAAESGLKPGAKLLIGTFSESGPTKCSGIPIHQYTEDSLQGVFSKSFRPLYCQREDHPTPFGTTQNFVFCSFERQ